MGPKVNPKDETDESVEGTDEEGEKGEGGEHEIDLIGKYLGDRNKAKQRHGNGWAILPNGDQYDGQYRRDQRHGDGLYVFKNGARYKGHYRCGIKSGYGTFYYPDGSKYEGNWRKDLKHGHGTYSYPNGDIYTGNWYKGKRHGLGEYYFAVNDCYFKGTWVGGVRVGPAEVYYKKHTLHGIWDDKYPQGPAIFSFNCKYMYKGYYKLLREQTMANDAAAEEGGEEIPEGFGEDIDKDDFKLDLEGEGEFFSQRDSLSTIDRAVPLWYCQDLLRYEFAKLPQQPVPLPISDSEEDICDLSSERHVTTYTFAEYEDEHAEKPDLNLAASKTSLSWSGSSPCISSPNVSQGPMHHVTPKTPGK